MLQEKNCVHFMNSPSLTCSSESTEHEQALGKAVKLLLFFPFQLFQGKKKEGKIQKVMHDKQLQTTVKGSLWYLR